MAPFSSVTLGLACLCLLSLASLTASSDDVSLTARFDEELGFSFSTSLVCEIAKCLKGQCVDSSALPYYKCECNSGWASPFGRSWLPCVLPNCSIDYACGNTTGLAPAPPPTGPALGDSLNICSLPICGNGKCVTNSSVSNSSDGYICQCDDGYVNLGNKSDGYCIRECALGANCASLGIPLGGTSPPPPPASLSSSGNSSSSNVNQDGMNAFQNRLSITAILLAFVLLWA